MKSTLTLMAALLVIGVTAGRPAGLQGQAMPRAAGLHGPAGGVAGRG